jgi:predicted ester cyclase
MAREENIAAQERFAEGVNSGNFDVFDEVVAPDVIDHAPAPEQGPGPQGFKEMFRTMRSAFPDLEVRPEHMTATDDDVALAYTITGTHEGESWA